MRRAARTTSRRCGGAVTCCASRAMTKLASPPDSDGGAQNPEDRTTVLSSFLLLLPSSVPESPDCDNAQRWSRCAFRLSIGRRVEPALIDYRPEREIGPPQGACRAHDRPAVCCQTV